MKKGKMKKRNVAMLGLGILGVSSVALLGGVSNVNADLSISNAKDNIQSVFGLERGEQGERGRKGGKMRGHDLHHKITNETSYEEFVELVKGTPLEGKTTEEKFNAMKEKMQEMENIRAEREAKREEIKKAVQSHDYETWKSLHNENSDIVSKIDSQEKFEKLIEMHSIMEEARTKADAIREELGIEKEPKKQHGPHGRKMMKNGNKMEEQGNTEK